MTNVLAQKAVLATLQISCWNAHRFDLKVTEEIHNDYHSGKDTGRYNKRLLPRSDLREIVSIIDRARAAHFKYTQPWLDDGSRVLPTVLYVDFTTEMKKLRLEFEAAVDKFCREYPNAIDRYQPTLGELFNRDDYPSVREIKRKFLFDVFIVPCVDTDDIRISISKEQISEVKRDLESRMDNVVTTAMKDKAEALHKLVEHMSERLKAYTPSKGKGERAEGTFKDSLVEKVRDLAQLLPAFNLTNDPKLKAITDRVVKELCKHDADVLRDDEEVRKQVAKNAARILKDVSAFMA
jgi:hypothetical protein